MDSLFTQILVAIPIAIALGVALVGLCVGISIIQRRVGIRMERPPISTVRRFFSDKYPDQSISWLRLAATEPTRSVVGVFYGGSRPPRYKFFAVDNDSEEVTELKDCRKYAPKKWR